MVPSNPFLWPTSSPHFSEQQYDGSLLDRCPHFLLSHWLIVPWPMRERTKKREIHLSIVFPSLISLTEPFRVEVLEKEERKGNLAIPLLWYWVGLSLDLELRIYISKSCDFSIANNATDRNYSDLWGLHLVHSSWSQWDHPFCRLLLTSIHTSFNNLSHNLSFISEAW